MAIALFLNIWNNDFPPYYHADEELKASFVRGAKQDFRQPLLLLELTRVAAQSMGAKTNEEILRIGRSISALAGACLVGLLFWFAVRVHSPAVGGLAAAAAAGSPLLVVHAHYMKEDLLGALLMLAASMLFMAFLRRQSWLRLAACAALTGLACATQYRALLLLGLFALAPLFMRSCLRQRRSVYFRLPVLAVIAALVFCAVNWRIFSQWEVFRAGIDYEWTHLQRGHDIKIPFSVFPWFHLRKSIVPGLTPFMAVFALSGVVWAMTQWRRLKDGERFMLVYAVVFYAACELTPLKPFPDYMRYMITIVPALLYFAVKGVREWGDRLPGLRQVFWAGMLVALAVSLRESVLLDYYLARDTRAVFSDWLAQQKDRVFCETYTAAHRSMKALVAVNLDDRRREGFRYAAASSFMYERFFFAEKNARPSSYVKNGAQFYRKLFQRPFIEIRPAFKSFAFSNPTIRIIALAPASEAEKQGGFIP